MKKFFKKLVGVVAVTVVGACMTGCGCNDDKNVLTFDLGADTTKPTMEFEGNIVVDKPADPTKDGYVFAGWYYNSSYTVPFDFSKAISSDTTIYAKWLKAVNLTVPSGDLVSSGYSLSVNDNKTFAVEGETLTLTLTLAKDYVSNSAPVFTANGQVLVAVETKIENNQKVITYQYTCDTNDVTFAVSGIIIDSYNITLPQVTGATIVSAEGYNNQNINKYQSYKFKLVADEGYNLANAKVYVNNILTSVTNGVYTINNITSNDIEIRVEDVKLNEYVCKFYDNTTQLNSLIAGKFKITNVTSIIQYKKGFAFDIEITDANYTQLGESIINYIDILVGQTKVNASLQKLTNTKFKVVVADELITNDIKVTINSNNFAINNYVVNLPNTTVQDNGYKLYFDKYVLGGKNYSIDTNLQSIKVPANAIVYVKAIFDTQNYNADNLKIVCTKGGNVTSKAYVQDGVGFVIDNNVEFSVIGLDVKYYSVNTDTTNGVTILPEENYTNKAYFVDYNNCDAKTYKFKISLNEVAYQKNSEFKVVYYTNDIANATTLQEVDNVYTIQNITSDTTIKVLGVEEKNFDVSTFGTINGLDSITIDDLTNKTVSYFDTYEIKAVVNQGYLNSINSIFMNCDNLTVIDRTIEGNIITFTVKNTTDNVTVSDLNFTGIVINSYTITVPSIYNRPNYTLSVDGNTLLGTTIKAKFGETLIIDILLNQAFTKDSNYTVLVNGEEHIVTDNQIVLANITNDIIIEVSGIDAVNTYSVNYYNYDGLVQIGQTNDILHGDEVSLIQNPTPSTNYEFVGWYIAKYDEDKTCYVATETKVEDGDIVTSDMVLIAVETAINYKISYILDTNASASATVNNSANVNTDDGTMIFNIETGTITFDTSITKQRYYTFDYFTLQNDALGMEAGTKITSLTITSDMVLSDITLVAHWKLVVGDGGDYYFNSLADAVFMAKTGDKIEIVSEKLENQSRVSITKSLTIVSVAENGTVIQSDSIGVVNNEYMSFISAVGSGEIISVNIENVTLKYSSIFTTYKNTTIYVKNCDLNLKNVSIESETMGVVFDSNVDQTILASDAENKLSSINIYGEGSINVSGDVDSAISLITGVENTEVNISDITIYCNAIEGFKAINANEGNILNITLNNVKFNGKTEVENEEPEIETGGEESETVDKEPGTENAPINTYAVYLAGEHSLAMDNCVVNDGEISAYTNAIMFANNFDNSTAVDKYLILNYTVNFVENTVISNNKFKDCLILTRNLLDNASKFKFVIGLSENNEDMTVNSDMLTKTIYFNNEGQLVNYVGFNVGMAYLSTASLNVSEFFVNEFQVIDFNNCNIVVNHLTNSGTIKNINSLKLVQVTNNGTIIASDIEFGNAENTGDAYADTILVSSDKTLTSNGLISANTSIQVDGNLNIAGSLDCDNLVNNGTVKFNSTESIIINTVINDGAVEINGEVELNGITNTGSITVNADAVLKINSSRLYNTGTITNIGEIVDNDQNTVNIGTFNDYGISNDYRSILLGSDNAYNVFGLVATKVDPNSQVAKLYPNGSGYYIGLKVCIGYNHAGENVNITYNRFDQYNYEYSYITKTVSDITDENGWLEIILDLNGQDFYTRLNAVEIYIQNSLVDYKFSVTFDTFSLINNYGGQIELGTINYYNLNTQGLTFTNTEGSNYTLQGTTIDKAPLSVIYDKLPGGTGYFMGFKVFLGTKFANSNVTIKIDRTEEDGVTPLFTTSTYNLEADSYGQVEILIDLNNIEGYTTLKKLNIVVSNLKKSDGNDADSVTENMKFNYTFNIDFAKLQCVVEG